MFYLRNILIFLHWKWPVQGTGTVPVVSAYFRSPLTWVRICHHCVSSVTDNNGLVLILSVHSGSCRLCSVFTSNSAVHVGPRETEFVLDWTPRVLRPGVTLTMDISFNMSKYAVLLIAL